MRNPYAPPIAPVADSIRPRPIEKPRQVIIAARLLWIDLALELVNWVVQSLPWTSSALVAGLAASTHLAVPSALGLGVRTWLTIRISEGRNWARVALLVMVLLSVVLNLVVGSRVLARSPMAEFERIGLTVLLLVALALLFTPRASEWFKRERGSKATGA